MSDRLIQIQEALRDCIDVFEDLVAITQAELDALNPPALEVPEWLVGLAIDSRVAGQIPKITIELAEKGPVYVRYAGTYEAALLDVFTTTEEKSSNWSIHRQSMSSLDDIVPTGRDGFVYVSVVDTSQDPARVSEPARLSVTRTKTATVEEVNTSLLPNYGRALGANTGRAVRIGNLSRQWSQGGVMRNYVRDVPAVGILHNARFLLPTDMSRNAAYKDAVAKGWSHETYGWKSRGSYSAGNPHAMAALCLTDAAGLPDMDNMLVEPSRAHIKAYSDADEFDNVLYPFDKPVLLDEAVRYAMLLVNAYPADVATFDNPAQAAQFQRDHPLSGQLSQNGSYIKDPYGLDGTSSEQPDSQEPIPHMGAQSIYALNSEDGVRWKTERRGLHFPFIYLMYEDGKARGLSYTDYRREHVEIDGLNRVRYIIKAGLDMPVGRIAVEFSHPRTIVPSGDPMKLTLTGLEGTVTGSVKPSFDTAKQNRHADGQFAAGYSVVRVSDVNKLLVRKGESVTLELSAPQGAAFRAWLRYPRILDLDAHVPQSQMQSSSDGGQTWSDVPYRNSNTCGHLLLA